MPFPQDQVAWLLANREKISRYMFIPQFLAAAVFLSFAYATGHVHVHLLFKGARTRGTIVALKPALISHRSSSTSVTWSTRIYLPLVEFQLGDRLIRFQEWKGSASNGGIGSSVPVIYDPADPSFAMLDHGPSNWFPWAPCFLIGLPVVFASLKGLFALFTPRTSALSLSHSSDKQVP